MPRQRIAFASKSGEDKEVATILSSCGTERRRTGKNQRFAEKSPKEVEEAEEAEVRSRSRAFSFGFDFRITSSKRLAAENLDRVN